MTSRFLTSLILACSAASTAGAQSIADRVSRAGDGTIRMSFATRPEICGRGGSISRGNSWRNNYGDNDRSRDVEWDNACDYGPGRLVLDKRDGEIVALRFVVGGRWRPAGSIRDCRARSPPPPASSSASCAAASCRTETSPSPTARPRTGDRRKSPPRLPRSGQPLKNSPEPISLASNSCQLSLCVKAEPVGRDLETLVQRHNVTAKNPYAASTKRCRS